MRLLLSAITLKVETSKGLKCTSSAPPALPAPPATPVTMDSVPRRHKQEQYLFV